MKSYRIELMFDGLMYRVVVDCYDDDIERVAERLAALHNARMFRWEKV